MTPFPKLLAAIALMAGAALSSIPAAAAGCQPGNGAFTACYYSGTAFNKFLLERQDPQIDFAWGLSGPFSGGPIFQFSARWQGNFNFGAGSYRFSVNADQGARLYIDGQLVVDRWTGTPAGSIDVTQTLTAGSHLIQLEYYDAWDFAYAKLSWSANKGYREFYISNSGNDNNDGRTPASAWATPLKVTLSSFQPGDHILFEGGGTFNGTVYVDEQGTASNPIVITSYGVGRATIKPGTSVGLLAYNAAGIEVSNLNFVGSPGNSKDGIQFYTDLPGNTKLSGIRLDNVEMSGFGSAGISIFSKSGTSGYDNIRITNVLSHDNVMAGLWMGGYLAPTFAGYSHSNLYIGNSKFYNNAGTIDFLTDSGFGIYIASTDGAVVEQNAVYNNGEKTVSLAGGPIGIMTMEANNIVVQNNEVHHMRTGWLNDGGGIAFDGGTTNSVMQYNYMHDNDGSGINLSQYNPVRVRTSNNTVRYNISQNDGRASLSWAGMVVAGPVQNSHIYNNTIYGAANTAGIYGALLITGQTTNLDVRNNVLITQGGTGGMQQISVAGGQVNMALQNNAYWGSGTRLNLNWNNTNSTTLADFRRASSQESFNGVSTGIETDPVLTAPGTAPTFNNASLLFTLTNYTPLPGSPLIDRGFNLFSLGLDPGTRDFIGTSVPQRAAFDIGAVEAK